MMSPVIKPAKIDPEAGKEFIKGIREGLEDYAEGRYKVFKDADELLALIDDEGLLTTLAKVGVTPEELAAFVEAIGR